ncbi:MAG: serine--tRNA ligase [Deltaproteobacteria bacterium]|nr:serine--tRNA ligase [Deltaproteobacteria bacterium]
MLDLKFVLENLPFVQEALQKKRVSFDLASLEKLNQKRKSVQVEFDQLRFRQNQVSQEIPKRKKEGKAVDDLLEQMKEVAGRVSDLSGQLSEVEGELNTLLLYIPNTPHPSVPVGTDSSHNKELRQWGKIPEFSFRPREHWEIGEQIGIFDFKGAAKIAGSRFVVYRGWGAKLERALINFMLDLHTRDHGYQEIWPPAMANARSLTGTANLPKFEGDLYKTTEGLYLIPTGEVPLTNLYQDEILEEKDLPVLVTAYTPCFRSEAGAAGKDTQGLIRQHQFDKVELMKFAHPEKSYEELEKLLSNAEEVLQLLELPYRVVTLCTGDMSFASAKTYDIEVWLPGQNGGKGAYREISSCTNFEDFQARRVNTRFRSEGKKLRYVHTLNGSGLAVGRTIAAILENFQDGKGFRIPKALVPYLGVERVVSN